MINLSFAAAVWILIHRIISGGPLRAPLIARFGANPYLAFFAALSIASLTWLVWAYAAVKPVAFAPPPTALAVGLAAVQLLAIWLVVAGLSTVGPTMSAKGHTVNDPDIARGMLRVTRHPFLWGVLLWAAAHLVVAHDAASILFFGAIGLVAIVGTFSIDGKRAAIYGDAWQAFRGRTSSLPFLAIAQGRQRLSLREIGAGRLGIGVLLWVAALALHPYLSGGVRIALLGAP